jgi:hypothetical protein
MNETKTNSNFFIPPPPPKAGPGKFTPSTRANAGTSLEHPGLLVNNEAEKTAAQFLSLDLFEQFANGVVLKQLAPLPFFQTFDANSTSEEKIYARLQDMKVPLPAYTFQGQFTKTVVNVEVTKDFLQNLERLGQHFLKLALGEGYHENLELRLPTYDSKFKITVKATSKVYLDDGTLYTNMPNMPAGSYRNVLLNIGLYQHSPTSYSLTATLLRGTYVN